MPHFWLRAETKPFERRAALTPDVASKLITTGFTVSVEHCDNRIFNIEQYRQAGCRIVPARSWPDAPPDCYVLGLKELPEPLPALRHKHIYFAHAYKQQKGWKALLGKFAEGGGQLLDLEYLLDDDGRRIAAFGYWAGFTGAALGVMAWSAQPDMPGAVGSYVNNDQLLAELAGLPARSSRRPKVIIPEVVIPTDTIPEDTIPKDTIPKDIIPKDIIPKGIIPKVIIIGAKGRCGHGAAAFCQGMGVETVCWDLEETVQGGPFPEILEHDIFLNCVLVNSAMPPFLTPQLLDRPRRLAVIVDISCDPYGDYNPLPVYDHCTTFSQPALRLRTDPVLDLIAIDHLPSMLPKESSEDFSEQLLPALLELPGGRTWQRALERFEEKKARALEMPMAS